MSYSRSERAALCALLTEAGPDAPTLCEGWTTHDLAAHLVSRETRPDAGPGLLINVLSPHTEKIRRELMRRHSYPELVDMIRKGPPRWSLFGIGPVGELANTIEYFVHHEDVRRAAEGWQPRTLDPGMEQVLWRRLRAGAKLLLRRAPVGTVLRLPNGATVVGRARDPWVTVTGSASELTLFVFGRQRASRVETDGDEAAVQALRNAKLSV
ncbi:MAG: TIGR03085 family protein [Streptosporangiales bacterium]|nr:TIGR03085 family protein [Streptosporangiales bacterium]